MPRSRLVHWQTSKYILLGEGVHLRANHRRDELGGGVERRHLRRTQLEISRGEIPLRLLDGARARDRHRAFGNAPADRDGRCLLYTSPSPRDCRLSRMPSSA